MGFPLDLELAMSEPVKTYRSAIRTVLGIFQRHAALTGIAPMITLLMCIGAAQSPPRASQNFAAIAREAVAARSSGRLSDAALLYERGLALHPDWQEGWWSLGMVQYVRNDYSGGARSFRTLTALNPKDGTGYVMLGLCEFELNQDSKALGHLKRGEEIGIPADDQLARVMRFHHGILLQRMGRFEGARQILDALCIDGEQPKPLLDELGLVALRLTDRLPPPKGSIAADVVSRVGVAMSYDAQHKLDQARQIYRDVAQKYPEFPNVHYAYGRFLSEQREFPPAAREYEQEISNYPKNVIARLQLASDYYRIDSATGVSIAEEAVRLDPQYPFGHYVLGLLLLDAGNYQRAISELELARSRFPRPMEPVYSALASAFAHVGRMEDAKHARAMCARFQSAQPPRDQGDAREIEAAPALRDSEPKE